MLLSCLIAFAVPPAAPALTVADFWPMTPGVTRTYKLREDQRTGELTETVGQPANIGGKEVVPIIASIGGFVQSHVYYAIVGDTLMQMAVSDTELLKTPVPVMKVGETSVKWSYTQLSPVSPKPLPLTVTAEAVRKGKRRILGVDREILEVKYSTQSPRGAYPDFKCNQTAVYAAGVGEVEFDTEYSVGKRTTTRKLELTAFTPGTSK
jgi:hypothetical protein